jgi:hypothetical protein
MRNSIVMITSNRFFRVTFAAPNGIAQTSRTRGRNATDAPSARHGFV